VLHQDEDARGGGAALGHDLGAADVARPGELLELTPEQMVAADMAMLLDLGRAEELADLIATQSLGAGDTVIDRASPSRKTDEEPL
jgi:hypothetical protein